MKTRLVRIGNSRGVRIPKPLIAAAELGDDVEIEVRDGSIIVSKCTHARDGWAKAARTLAMTLTREQEALVDPPTSTRFDDEQWEW